MKKIISIITALSLIGCHAYSPVVLNETYVSAESGLTESVRIHTDNDIFASNGMLTIDYDFKKLDLKEVVLNPAVESVLYAVNTQTPGKITIAFASDKEITVSEYIADLIFYNFTDGEEKAYSLCELTVDELVTIGENGSDKEVPSDDIVISEGKSDVNAFLSGSESEDPDYLNVHLSLYMEYSSVTNGMFTIKYDTSELEFESGEMSGDIEGSLCEIFEAEKGTIKIALVNGEGIIRSGHAADLKFKMKKPCNPELTLTVNELQDITMDDKIQKFIIEESSYVFDTGFQEQDPVLEAADLTSDGSITSLDLITLIKILIGVIPESECPGADINRDGAVDTEDLVAMKKMFIEA